jgi:hypothetical protein
MATGRPRYWRDPAKERFWRRTVGRWRRSGLNVRDFCAEAGVTEPAFYHWRRELAKREGPPTAAGRPAKRAADRGPGSGVKRGGTARFVPVRVVVDDVLSPGVASPLELHLPSGVRLCVPAGFDRQTLADVLAALDQRSC